MSASDPTILFSESQVKCHHGSENRFSADSVKGLKVLQWLSLDVWDCDGKSQVQVPPDLPRHRQTGPGCDVMSHRCNCCICDLRAVF
jgi:hypothetical protein